MAMHLSGVVNLDTVYQWMRREAKRNLAIKYRFDKGGNEPALYGACGYNDALQDLAKLLGINWQEVEDLRPFAK